MLHRSKLKLKAIPSNDALCWSPAAAKTLTSVAIGFPMLAWPDPHPLPRGTNLKGTPFTFLVSVGSCFIAHKARSSVAG